MSVFEHPEFDHHEHVSFFCDPSSGLRAIVAIHSTSALGISGGGCRMWPYASDDAALRDALRLSKAMTYKLALAELPSGGAKCVVIGDSTTDKTPELLRALGRAVSQLGGRYVIAEDVGTTPADMEQISRETPYVAGRAGGSGDTTPATAQGVFLALEQAVQRRLGRDNLDGLRVGIQGVGGVGSHLARLLAERGVTLTVADVNRDACARMAREFGAAVVAPDQVLAADVDVFAPCALGDIITDETVAELRCAVMAGAANNQLTRDDLADALSARGILYAPDFVANMGGVIGANQLRPNPARVARRLQRIPQVLAQIFDEAEKQGVSTHLAAVQVANQSLAAMREQGGSKWARGMWQKPWVARTVLRVRSAVASARLPR